MKFLYILPIVSILLSCIFPPSHYYSLEKRAEKELETRDFAWCDCDNAGAASRLDFSTKVITHVQKTFTDKNQKIVLSSYGSGMLLNEYIIVAELVEQGFKNIDLNLIDAIYGEMESEAFGIALRNDDHFFGPPFDELEKRKLYAAETQKRNETLTRRLRSAGLVGDIKFFADASAYEESCNNGSASKSDIILGIDLSTYELDEQTTSSLVEKKSSVLNELSIEPQAVWLFDENQRLIEVWTFEATNAVMAASIENARVGMPMPEVYATLSKNGFHTKGSVNNIISFANFSHAALNQKSEKSKVFRLANHQTTIFDTKTVLNPNFAVMLADKSLQTGGGARVRLSK